MTAATEVRSPDPHETGGAGQLRKLGRGFILAVYRALRSLKLYPKENERVQQALDELMEATTAIQKLEGAVELRTVGELMFINESRLRMEMDTYASFSHVLNVLQNCGIGTLSVAQGVERDEWRSFVSILLRTVEPEPDPTRLEAVQAKLNEAAARHIAVGPPTREEADDSNVEERKERAKRTYERSLAVTKEVVSSARMGRSAGVKKVKRAVQNIVDQVLSNEIALVGLTTLRDYDDYTFTHSVNVAIFSLAIGRRLGLTKQQLYDLGMSALVHDVGKGRIPSEVLNKQAKLTDDEWFIMQSHTWLGSLALFRLRDYGEVPYRSMITAYEHHMRLGGKGYPRIIRARELTVFSKIIAVADTFDAATSVRVYKPAKTPDQILAEMWTRPDLGFEPLMVKALINLLGIYPVGTCVILDTNEVGIVHAANPDPSELHRPIVRVVLDPAGNPVDPAPLVDTAEVGADGEFCRKIAKVTEADRFGITPSDYFV